MEVLVGPHDRRLLSPALCAVVAGLFALGGAETGAAAAPDPPRRADADGDGVVDADDRCPAAAGLPPHGCPPSDRDGDQLLDADDACPALPGPEVNRGCPDRDQDGDGIVDRRDRCAEQYGHPGFQGCPPPDADADAVPDPDDRCPTEPEVWNGERDRDGCPDRGAALAEVEGGRIRLPHLARITGSERSLSKRGKKAIKVAVSALRSAHSRSLRLEVVAEYGLSYGDSLQRARRRALTVQRALLEASDLSAEQIEVVCLGPDGKPRIELVYR